VPRQPINQTVESAVSAVIDHPWNEKGQPERLKRSTVIVQTLLPVIASRFACSFHFMHRAATAGTADSRAGVTLATILEWVLETTQLNLGGTS